MTLTWDFTVQVLAQSGMRFRNLRVLDLLKWWTLSRAIRNLQVLEIKEQMECQPVNSKTVKPR